MVWRRPTLDNSQKSQEMKKFQHLINTESKLMIKVRKVWPVINAIRKTTTNHNALNWQESSSRMSIRHLWGRCMLREKTSTHRSFHRCKTKGISQCGTGPEHSVPSISAEEAKMEKYQNHFKHWDRNEYYLSALCYEVKIKVHKECEVTTIWVNQQADYVLLQDLSDNNLNNRCLKLKKK